MQTIIDRLAEEWKTNPHDPEWPTRALAAIRAHPPRPKAETKNPDRTNSIAVALTKLRNRCFAHNIFHPEFKNATEKLREQYPNDPAWEEFNPTRGVKPLTQLQRLWRASNGLKLLLVKVPVVPDAIKQLKLSKEEAAARRIANQLIATEKLNHATEFTWPLVRDAILPGLALETVPELAAALLLATGRRVIEILKLAEFKKIGPTRVLFKGQAKAGAEERKPYEIDLLAPADAVINGLKVLRRIAPCEKFENDEATLRYGGVISRYVNKVLTCHTHLLRTIYAVAAENIFNRGTKVSMIGYMKQMLGHINEAETTKYQCVKLQMTLPPPPPSMELISCSKQTAKRVTQIHKMMEEGKEITLRSVSKATGASRDMLIKLFALPGNGAVIEAHNNKVYKLPEE